MDLHENYLELIVLVNDVDFCILGCENLDWTHSKLMVAVMKSCLLSQEFVGKLEHSRI